MKRKLIAALAVAGLVVSGLQVPWTGGTAEAGKPPNVVQWSNGFPSGPHFNLNIHGKKADFVCPAPDPLTGEYGGSVFVPVVGDSVIEYVSNKSTQPELKVLDPCSKPFDNDAARVQLPKGEYQVYARILAKPKNTTTEATVTFSPKLLEYCAIAAVDDPNTPEDETDVTECLDGTGVVTTDGVFKKDGQTLTRIAPTGSGKNLAVDISDMFKYTGWACPVAADLTGDKVVDWADVIEFDTDNITTLVDGDITGDNILDAADFDAYALLAGCTKFTDEWVFNLADLVVYGWDYKNNGAKLVQVRFYPITTLVTSP